jgi:hypothetical protein
VVPNIRKTLKNIKVKCYWKLKIRVALPNRVRSVWTFKTHFPQGEFVRANFKKVGTDPTFWRRLFSLTNHIAKIYFSLHANKFAYILENISLKAKSQVCYTGLSK